jgi:hypothetical protein
MIDAVFLNLGPPSKVSVAEAAADIRAILESGVDWLVGCEAVGKGQLPRVESHEVIRDRTRPSRANIYAYARKGQIKSFKWEDMVLKFDREPGRPGKHPPRSYTKYRANRVHNKVAHHPPAWPGTGAAREEHLRRLRHDFAPWTDHEYWERIKQSTREQLKARPQVLFWDRNMTMPAFRKFAASCDAWAVGDKIDCMMGRNVVVLDQGYQRKFDGHTVHTDHPWGAFHIRFKVASLEARQNNKITVVES